MSKVLFMVLVWSLSLSSKEYDPAPCDLRSFLPDFYDTYDYRIQLEEELACCAVTILESCGKHSAQCRGCNFRNLVSATAKSALCGCCGREFPLTMAKSEPINSSCEQPIKYQPFAGKIIKEDQSQALARRPKRPLVWEENTEAERPVKVAKMEGHSDVKSIAKESQAIQSIRPTTDQLHKKTNSSSKRPRSPVLHALAWCALNELLPQQRDILNGTLSIGGFDEYQRFLGCIIEASKSETRRIINDREKRHNSLQRYLWVLADNKISHYSDLPYASVITLQINAEYLYRFQIEINRLGSSSS
jgi:hypothetical protein